MNPAFDRYARYFPSTTQDFFCRFPAVDSVASMGIVSRSVLYYLALMSGNALHAIQRRGCDTGLIRLRRDELLDLDSPEFLAYLRKHRAVFVQDWFFRSPVDCEKHGDVIRAFFTPWEHHLARTRAVVETARRNGNLLVGIHIRQGDPAHPAPTASGHRFTVKYRGMKSRIQLARPHSTSSTWPVACIMDWSLSH